MVVMSKRRFAGALCALMLAVIVLSTATVAMAAEEPISVTFSPEQPFEYEGLVSVVATITNNTAESLTLTGISPKVGSGSNILSLQSVSEDLDGSKQYATPIAAVNQKIEAGEENAYSCKLTLKVRESLRGEFRYDNNEIKFSYTYKQDGNTMTGTLLATFSFYKVTQLPEPTETPSPEDAKVASLVLSPVGADGKTVPAPSGNAGDKVRVRLPIRNRQGYVVGAEISPVLSSSLDEFPFEIDTVDYTRRLPNLYPGNMAEVVYDFKLSSEVTSGVKAVTFNAIYSKDGVLETSSFKVYVNVIKGAAGTEYDKDGNPINKTSTPKLIIESYSTGEERIYAGKAFDLSLTLRNTSDKEDIKNLKVTLKSDNGALLPADGGSNTVYIKSIAKGEKETKVIALQAPPDAEAKAQTLTVTFNYEGSNATPYESVETLTLPVSQEMRVKVDDPVTYGEGMVEQPVTVSFGLYNMGKSTLYNCMVEVDVDGLRMDETYFGGNIGSGSTMRADFDVIPSKAGLLSGNIVIIYEDAYGEQTRVEKPFELNVMEAYSPDMDMGMPDDKGIETMPSGGSKPWGLYIGGGVVLVGLVTFFVLRKRAKRKKELEAL